MAKTMNLPQPLTCVRDFLRYVGPLNGLPGNRMADSIRSYSGRDSFVDKSIFEFFQMKP